MKRMLLAALVVFMSSISAAVNASDAPLSPELASKLESQRPKIGLALSGGGAKGAAHLGVIKYLEQHHIPIDYISGTSMGSFIGGLYAMGLSSDQIETMLIEYDWNQGYNDDVSREHLSVREKQRQDSFQIRTHIGFNGTEIKLPSGFVQGQGMAKLLRLATHSLPYVDDFDRLPIPFRAVATDVETIQPVALAQGDMAKVMQASMAIPGALTPVEINGRQLVDGGIVNNLPIDQLQAMGADIIIAVDIGSQLYEQEDISSALVIFDQLSSSMTRNSANQQIATLSQQDVLLAPDITGIGATDFELMPTAIKRGEQAAVQASEQLIKLSLPVPQYRQYQRQKQTRTDSLASSDMVNINAINIITDTRLSPRVIQNKLQLRRGDRLSISELEARIDQLYALNLFQKVDYTIAAAAEPDQHDITINVVEKSWGPGYVDFKFNIQESTSRDDLLQIGLQYTLTDINRLGAEWQSEFIYGTDSRISTEFYTPLDYRQLFFFRTGLQIEEYQSKLYLANQQDPSLRDLSSTFEYFAITTEQNSVFAEFGLLPSNWAQIAIGGYYQRGTADLAGSNFSSDFTSQGWYTRIQLDSLDNISFPSKGFKFDGTVYVDAGDYLENDDDSVFVDLNLRSAWSWQRSTVELKASAASYNGPAISPTFAIGLGGFQNLSGYGINEITGNYKGLVAAVYRHRLLDNNLGAFSFPLYVGASAELGNVWNDRDEVGFDTSLLAGSVFIALDTGIGPVMLAYGQAEGGHQAGYLFIGNNF